MSLYQIRARQGPHIKTYLISWQLFGPKISLEIHCWPITTFFKTVGENFSQCQIVLFCMMVSNCPRCQIVPSPLFPIGCHYLHCHRLLEPIFVCWTISLYLNHSEGTHPKKFPSCHQFQNQTF